MQAAGASDILAVDLSPKMLSEIDRRFGRAPTLGNSAAVRTWLGDICELPDHQGMAHAIYLNGMFGNLLDPHAALLKCCTLLQPEGYVIVSHPLGLLLLGSYDNVQFVKLYYKHGLIKTKPWHVVVSA
jgi:SAM-dependent methyltransferase